MEYFPGSNLNDKRRKIPKLHKIIVNMIKIFSENRFTHYDLSGNILYRKKETEYVFDNEIIKSDYEIKVIDLSRSFIDGVNEKYVDCTINIISPGLFNPIADFMYYLFMLLSHAMEDDEIEKIFSENEYNHRGEYGGLPENGSSENRYYFDPEILRFGNPVFSEKQIESYFNMSEEELKSEITSKFKEYYFKNL